MSPTSRFSAHAWLLVLLCACGFLVWVNCQRAQRVDYVTNTDHEAAVVDATSPTGYAGGKRWLIVPEHNNRSYQWIAETQQMLAMSEWRVRHVDYENAPLGRDVYSASPYRWLLGLVAWVEHLASGRPLGFSVERAALWADPLLHLLLLAGATIYVARKLGSTAAILLALGLAMLYPFAGGFLPGVPDDHGLARVCAFWSVLPLLVWTGGTLRATTKQNKSEAAAVEAAHASRRAHQSFFIAGVAGGLGLWIGTSIQVAVLVGLVFGGLLAAWIRAKDTHANPKNPSEPMPWRTWALAGASTCLIAYLIEYFPGHMDFQLQTNHPVYGVAWIGAGELLAQFETWSNQRKSFWSLRRASVLLLAVAAVAALPVATKLSGTQSLLSGDLLSSRLTSLPTGTVAKSFSAWVGRDGLTAAVTATCLPLLLLGPALGLLARRNTDVRARMGIALALGPVLVALPLACQQLAWWNTCDALLLALLVTTSTAWFPAVSSSRNRWLWSGFVGLIFLPGLVQLMPPAKVGGNIEFTRFEVEGLVERALAHWIADHAGPNGAVILIPPDRTTSWCFHGGLRGLGTANWENRDGLAATIRIVTATSADEAQALINQRGVTHLILPSWDSDLDEFARWSLRNPEDAFIMALHHWALPPWLRPLPYTLPTIAGFEDRSVVILEVTNESNRAAALSRLAEYFIETQQTELAASTSPSLQRYPADLGALVALAQVEKARANAEGFTKAFKALEAALTGGLDRTLAWDRRVSLAIVLALGERNDLAREQVRRCLEKIDEARLRSLTTASLFRLQVLAKAYELKISDPRLRELAGKLLPVELRARLQ
jgi:uncharacterized membrane protein YhaH (DUF805 family)